MILETYSQRLTFLDCAWAFGSLNQDGFLCKVDVNKATLTLLHRAWHRAMICPAFLDVAWQEDSNDLPTALCLGPRSSCAQLRRARPAPQSNSQARTSSISPSQSSYTLP